VNQAYLKAMLRVNAKERGNQKWMLIKKAKNEDEVKDKCYRRN
jgi:hypothetical protein